jgi:hypothetical protein
MHDMPSVFSYSQTALTGDDISYLVPRDRLLLPMSQNYGRLSCIKMYPEDSNTPLS